MKKIKYLFGIGILGAFFSTCFGSYTSGTLSVFHSIDTINGNSNAYFGTWDQNGAFKKNIPNYNSITGGQIDFWGNSYGIQIGNTWTTSRNQILPSFRFDFYSPYGFVITGSNYNGNFDVVSLIDSSYTFFGGLNQNYYNGDFYPFIFNSDTQEYLTFNNENTLAFNGHTYNFGTGYGLLKYCFYGIDYDLSCLFYNGSSYNYVNFSLNNDIIVTSTGFFIIPLHTSNTVNNKGSFTGNSTLIISPIYSNQLAYNIIDLYSFDVFDLKNSNIIDKGVINIDRDSFLNRTFLSMPSVSNTNTIKNGLGYFSEIFEKSGSYFYRSNSVLSYGNNTASDNIGNCLYRMHSCIPYGSLELVSNQGIPDILASIHGGGNGNQSTGSIAINTGFLDLCLNNLEFGELNSYLCSKLLNGNNLVLIPNMTGYYLSYGYDENGNLTFWITYQEDLEQQMSGFVWVQDENGNRYTTCPSGDCLGSILAKPINHGDGNVFELSTGDVLDMFTNLTGWVGRCPFPYTDFRLGKNLKLLQTLQDLGFNYDPFIIVNCAVAGFHYGRNSINQSLIGDVFEHPLLYGDTQKHQILFNFLDFIVILGLIGLFTFIRKIF